MTDEAPYSIADLLYAAGQARKAGDTAAADHLRAEATKLQQAADREAYSPTKGSTGIQNLREGVGRGMMNVARHLHLDKLPQWAGLSDSSPSMEDARALDAPLMDTTGGQWGDFIGTTAATALPAAGLTGAVSRLGAMGSRLAANAVSRGAMEGAAQGYAMADPDGTYGQDALAGGAMGAALPVAGRAVSTIARGLKRTPAAQALLDRGVSLTPGQMNPEGLAGTVEQLPIVSQLVEGSRAGAKRDVNRVMSEAASAPGTKIADGSMDEMLGAAYKSFEPLYEQGKGFPVGLHILNPTGRPVQLSQTLRRAAKAPGVTEEIQNSVGDWLQSQLNATLSAAKTRGGALSDDLLKLRSDIRDQARAYGRKSDTNALMYEKAYENAEAVVTKALESQLPDKALRAVQTADRKYGDYKTLEKAVFASKDRPTGPTPHEVLTALASENRGAKSGAHARRARPNELRELANAAGQVFAENPRGKTGASWWPTALLGGSVLAKPLIGVPAGLGALSLAVTPGGRQLAAGQKAWQRGMAGALDSIQSRIGPVNRGLLEEFGGRAAVTGGSNMFLAHE